MRGAVSPQHPRAAPFAAKIWGFSCHSRKSHQHLPAAPGSSSHRVPKSPPGAQPPAAEPALPELSQRLLCSTQPFLPCKRAQTDPAAANWGNWDLPLRKEPRPPGGAAQRGSGQHRKLQCKHWTWYQTALERVWVHNATEHMVQRKSWWHELAPGHSWLQVLWPSPTLSMALASVGAAWQRPGLAMAIRGGLGVCTDPLSTGDACRGCASHHLQVGYELLPAEVCWEAGESHCEGELSWDTAGRASVGSELKCSSWDEQPLR